MVAVTVVVVVQGLADDGVAVNDATDDGAQDDLDYDADDDGDVYVATATRKRNKKIFEPNL